MSANPSSTLSSATISPISFSLREIKLEAVQQFCLFLAIGLYAFFGSPTPDSPGLFEALIGVLLIIAVGTQGMSTALLPSRAEPLWRITAQILLLYGLSAGILSGLLNNNAPSLILRDLIPFIFLLLPLFYQVKSERERRLLILFITAAGLVFALRALTDFWADPVGLGGEQRELTYLANAPTLLLASIVMLGVAGRNFAERFTPGALMLFIFALLIATIPLAAMGVTLQRASLGYFVVALIILGVIGLIKYPLRTFLAVAAAGLLAFPFVGDLAILSNLLQEKTAVFGLNMRGAEWSAVFNEIAQTPLHALFGSGWGGTFESPAVADIRVNFTHGLLSSALLKTGVIGAALTMAYIAALLRELLKYVKIQPVLVLAILGPVLIDVFLYASFKSLDFGLVLLLIPSLKALTSADSLQDEAGYCNQKH